MNWPQPRHSPLPPARSGPDGAAPRRGGADPCGQTDDGPRRRTVFVTEDELLLHGLAHVIGHALGVRIVGDVGHGSGTAERLRRLDPDLVIVDVNLGVPLQALLADLERTPKVVVVVDREETAARALDLIHAGADALVDRRSPSSEIRDTVARVLDGHAALDAHSVTTLIAELRAELDAGVTDHMRSLTRREREVLTLLTDGLDNREIAADLFIAEATVKFHLHNIMAKFGVHKRAALVSAALRGQGRRGPGHHRPSAGQTRARNRGGAHDRPRATSVR